MHVSLQSSLRFYQVLNQRQHAIHDEGCSKEETLVATSVIVSISDKTSKVQVQRKMMFMCCTSLPALCSSDNEPAAYRCHMQRSPDLAPLVGNEPAAYHSHTQRSPDTPALVPSSLSYLFPSCLQSQLLKSLHRSWSPHRHASLHRGLPLESEKLLLSKEKKKMTQCHLLKFSF